MSWLANRRLNKREQQIRKALRSAPACSVVFDEKEQDQVGALNDRFDLIGATCTLSYTDETYTLWTTFGHNAAAVWQDFCRMTRCLNDPTMDMQEEYMNIVAHILPQLKTDLEKEYGIQLGEFDPAGSR